MHESRPKWNDYKEDDELFEHDTDTPEGWWAWMKEFLCEEAYQEMVEEMAEEAARDPKDTL